jgi:hypothetical protein
MQPNVVHRMEQVEKTEVPFCSSWGQKNETNLPATIPDLAFSVPSDRFFNESVSPQLLFFLIPTKPRSESFTYLFSFESISAQKSQKKLGICETYPRLSMPRYSNSNVNNFLYDMWRYLSARLRRPITAFGNESYWPEFSSSWRY